jgi:hypothetical protein
MTDDEPTPADEEHERLREHQTEFESMQGPSEPDSELPTSQRDDGDDA